MSDPSIFPTIGLDQFGAAISAAGALGVAAFGFTEAAGKALAFSAPGRGTHGFQLGLPYVGLKAVREMIRPLEPALHCAYGDDYLTLITQQYRADRGEGAAPDTIRQGVRLGLPYLSLDKATHLISRVWSMPQAHSRALALALQAVPEPCPPPDQVVVEGDGSTISPVQAQALAGRFATALDKRIAAAFDLAEERYEAVAKCASGVVAVGMAVGFNAALPQHYSVWVALGLGLVAVPLAPVAKDLSTSLQSALTAFKSLPGRKG